MDQEEPGAPWSPQDWRSGVGTRPIGSSFENAFAKKASKQAGAGGRGGAKLGEHQSSPEGGGGCVLHMCLPTWGMGRAGGVACVCLGGVLWGTVPMLPQARVRHLPRGAHILHTNDEQLLGIVTARDII